MFEEVRGSQSGYNPFSGGGRYRCYRGRFPKRFDPSLPYALPVRPGTAVEWMTDRRERHKTMNFKMSPGDTIYAVSSGSVCMTIDGRLLLVYHSPAYLSHSSSWTATSLRRMRRRDTPTPILSPCSGHRREICILRKTWPIPPWQMKGS